MSSKTVNLHTGHSDPVGARLGMWLFLFTEFLLFGGLFLLYSVYRSNFKSDFHFAATTLSLKMGTINTVILLTSSLTMVLAVASLVKRDRKNSSRFIMFTIFLGFVFLINKYFEWSAKIGHGLFPNSEVLESHTAGEKVFYSLYYLMTGMHALHIIIGIIILAVMYLKIRKRPFKRFTVEKAGTPSLTLSDLNGKSLINFKDNEQVESVKMDLIFSADSAAGEKDLIKLENSGLYWHLVDVIWIFLFPLFYLIT